MLDKIGAKWRKFRYWLKHDFLSAENAALVAAVVLCLVWTYQSIEAMSRNWELNERLNTEKKTLELLAIETEMMELENEYYRSDEYRDLMARKLANKQLAGEKMVYLPENSEVAKNKHKVQNIAASERQYSNIEKWWMYLFP